MSAISYGDTIQSALAIVDCWRLSDRQAGRLLGVSTDTLSEWRTNTPRAIDNETIERLALVQAIWDGLQALFPQGHKEWPSMICLAPTFNGEKPIDRMCDSIEGLRETKRWVYGQVYG